MMRNRFVILALLLAATGALAREPGFAEFRAVQESLSRVPPRLRTRWLNERGLEIPGINAPMPDVSLAAESTSLRLVGKYGRGPSVEVTGRDSLVFLSLGSEVAIINFADTANPHVLAEVQAMGLVTQTAVRDSFLYVGCNAGQAGIEVWNVQNPSAPVFRSRVPTLLSDFCVRDTLLYLTQSLSGPNDTFKIYSIANPENVYLLGSCRDSGNAVAVTNNAAFIADRWGLYSMDVTDPRSPHHAGTYPGVPISVDARGNICCVTFGNPNQPEWLEFDVLDVTNPDSMRRLGFLSDAGGSDMMLDGSLVFLSGYFQGSHEFKVISLADSTQPVALGQCATPGMNFGVWGDSSRGLALVADRTEGLAVIDVRNLGAPSCESAHLVAGMAQDVSVDRGFCYVASLDAGMRILDVTTPARPVEVGALDTVSTGLDVYSVVARDSIAYLGWWPQPYLRSASVQDPSNPQFAGRCSVFASPEDMALRDSFLYVAEDYKFQVVNVARPRQPVVVGTCGLGDYSYGMCLLDSLAYVSTYPLAIISVANPSQPETVGSIPRGTWSVFVEDTLAYLAAVGLHVWNVANPASPIPVDSLTFGHMVYDVVVVDSLAYLACSDGLRLANVADPHNMRVIALHSLPYIGWRLVYDSPYVYVATQDAGVCIFETTATGVSEAHKPSRPGSGIRLAPNPARNWVDIIVTSPLASPCRLSLIDVTGREVASVRAASGPSYERRTRIELRRLAPGLYFLRAGTEGWSGVLKLVKQ